MTTMTDIARRPSGLGGRMMSRVLPHRQAEPLVGAADHLALARLMTTSAWHGDEGTSDRCRALFIEDGELLRGDSVLKSRAAIPAEERHRDKRRSGLVRAWCAQVWRWVLLGSQAMAGYDLTGQFAGWPPAEGLVVPDGHAVGPPGADEPRALMAEATPHAEPERRRGFTPAEQARLRVLRARHPVSCAPFTTREVARLCFVRWLHQTGRVTP